MKEHWPTKSYWSSEEHYKICVAVYEGTSGLGVFTDFQGMLEERCHTVFPGLSNVAYAKNALIMFGIICSEKNVAVYGKDWSMFKYD